MMVNVDKCKGSYNIFDDLSSRICVPNNTENGNTNVLNMITRINELKTLTKHILCKFKCKVDGRKCNSEQEWNINKCRCEYKNPRKQHLRKKYIYLESYYMYL